MDRIRLGRTGLMVSRSGFGAIPIQRLDKDRSTSLLRKAYEGGINFFDTAHGYTDSEEKIGLALADVRSSIVIATKTPASDPKGVLENLELSLSRLRTDYIDIYQFHNPRTVPWPGDGTGMYEALLEARSKGLIRFIGMTNHRQPVAREALESGLYDTLQFPFSSLSSDTDRDLLGLAREKDVGFIAMKGLAGGLITNARAAFAFMRSTEYAVPIWGMQRESELEEFLALERDPPALDQAMWKIIEKDRAELAGSFCRGCGYCLPCPAGIETNTAARISLLMTRSRFEPYVTPEWREKMERIDGCTHCGHCRDNCPYGLDTPELLKEQLAWYRGFVKDRGLAGSGNIPRRHSRQ
jgi:predicted aldo/keto reductase-like oxidoreductase